MLDEHTAAGHVLRKVLADRGFSNWDEETWADQLLARDVDQVIDINQLDRGARADPETGVLMIDGWPYLPWTPKRLHMIARPIRLKLVKPKAKAKPKKVLAYEKLHAELEVFRRREGLRAHQPTALGKRLDADVLTADASRRATCRRS